MTCGFYRTLHSQSPTKRTVSLREEKEGARTLPICIACTAHLMPNSQGNKTIPHQNHNRYRTHVTTFQITQPLPTPNHLTQTNTAINDFQFKYAKRNVWNQPDMTGAKLTSQREIGPGINGSNIVGPILPIVGRVNFVGDPIVEIGIVENLVSEDHLPGCS